MMIATDRKDTIMVSLTKAPTLGQELLTPTELHRLPEVRLILAHPRRTPLGMLGGRFELSRRFPTRAPIVHTSRWV